MVFQIVARALESVLTLTVNLSSVSPIAPEYSLLLHE